MSVPDTASRIAPTSSNRSIYDNIAPAVAARDSGIDALGLTTPHLVYAARLDWGHGDPWDRILLAQATLEDLDLISADGAFDELTDRRMW